jgi:hypothetical protein
LSYGWRRQTQLILKVSTSAELEFCGATTKERDSNSDTKDTEIRFVENAGVDFQSHPST